MKFIKITSCIFAFAFLFSLTLTSYANNALSDMNDLLAKKLRSSVIQPANTQTQITQPARTVESSMATSPIGQIQQTHSLYFFFLSTCPHCHRFLPILKRWVNHYGFSLQSFSLDGGPLPGVGSVHRPSDALKHIFFTSTNITVPALFLVNNKTHQIYPVSTGALSLNELDVRVKTLATRIAAFEKRQGAGHV